MSMNQIIILNTFNKQLYLMRIMSRKENVEKILLTSEWWIINSNKKRLKILFASFTVNLIFESLSTTFYLLNEFCENPRTRHGWCLHTVSHYSAADVDAFFAWFLLIKNQANKLLKLYNLFIACCILAWDENLKVKVNAFLQWAATHEGQPESPTPTLYSLAISSLLPSTEQSRAKGRF